MFIILNAIFEKLISIFKVNYELIAHHERKIDTWLKFINTIRQVSTYATSYFQHPPLHSSHPSYQFN